MDGALGLHVDLAERAAADSWEIGDGIVIDVDIEGHPVGIDIGQASKHIDLVIQDLREDGLRGAGTLSPASVDRHR